MPKGLPREEVNIEVQSGDVSRYHGNPDMYLCPRCGASYVYKRDVGTVDKEFKFTLVFTEYMCVKCGFIRKEWEGIPDKTSHAP